MSASNYAKHLQVAREASGKTIEEMAALLGITFESYRDLEMYDDEVVDCISIQQFITLSISLNIASRKFFSGESYSQSQVTSFNDLAVKIKEVLITQNMPVAEFEDRVGWEVAKALENPKIFSNYNISALTEICNAVGVDWVSLLPIN